MKLKKNALWLLVLLITLTILSITPASIVKASATKVSIDYFGQSKILDPALVPGTQFTVNITVDYVEELWSYQFELGEYLFQMPGWNASVLKLVAFDNGPFLGSAGGNVEWFPGKVNNTIGAMSLSGAALNPKRRFPTGGGTLATLTFEVVGYGASPIHFGLDTALLNKTNGYKLGPDWEPLRGTLNPDFLVDGYFDNRAQVKVEPSKVTGVLIGKNFTINIDVVNITHLNNWIFSLEWNATLLNITSVTEGEFLKSQGPTSFSPGNINRTAGEILDVSASLTTTTQEVSGDGTLASITFVVLNEGTTELTLNNVTLHNSAGNILDIGTINGFFTNLRFHNIEITSITPNPTKVKAKSGEPVNIDVVVTNVGDFNETGIDVTTYYDGNLIGKVEEISLDTQTNKSKTLSFTWNTTGVPRGVYTIYANASFVAEEVETTDNARESPFNVTIWAHDVAIISVSTPVSNVFAGYSVNITVKVANEGTEVETFNVTVSYDENEIGTQEVTNLGYKESRELKFEWDTTGVEIGAYSLSAKASFVEGEEEEDQNDNIYIKPDKINIIPLEEEVFSTGFLILISLPFVIIGIATILYIRKRKTAET